MKKGIAYLLAALLLGGLAQGCGDSKDKDVNRDKDKPKAEKKEG
jgi:hypothetical protein